VSKAQIARFEGVGESTIRDSINRVSRLMHEYEIARNLNLESIVKPMGLEQAGSLFALIMEDVGAISLRKYKVLWMPCLCNQIQNL